MLHKASVSNLEAYRLYCASEDASIDKLVSQIVEGVPSTPEMEVGTAIHTCLEHGFLHPITHTESGIRIFIDPIGKPIYAPNSEVYMQWVSDCGLIVSGRVDAIDYRTIWDHKVTGGAGKYFDAIQWRAYLTMFNADRFIYNVFKRSEISQDDQGKSCRIFDFFTEEYTRYSGMTSEIQDACRDYLVHIAPAVEQRRQERKRK